MDNNNQQFDNNQQTSSSQEVYNNQQNYSAQQTYGSQQAYNAQQTYGNQQAYNAQQTYGNQQAYSQQPVYTQPLNTQQYYNQPYINQPAIPPEYTPISMWGYFGYELLFAIPCIGFIILLVFAFGGTKNVNVKNFARSYFCLLIILAILLAVLSVFAGGLGALFSFSYGF